MVVVYHKLLSQYRDFITELRELTDERKRINVLLQKCAKNVNKELLTQLKIQEQKIIDKKKSRTTIIRPTDILNGHFITHILLYVVMRNNLVNNDLLCHNDNKHHPVLQNSVLHNSVSSVYLYTIFRESYTQIE